MDHEGPVLRDVTAQHINVAGRQSKSTVCISEDYPTMEMTGEHMRVSLSALQPECEFQTAAQGYRNPIHETNPRYCEATTVEIGEQATGPTLEAPEGAKRSIQSIHNGA
ncbi:hypothetical protein V495_02219 [Pseudogymnoascus sp. VKM F-4514 (FW-929)]|nr:hypothetical protein V495_02219 [Pseudogymnoascus sp. VKM F-4514 (FW-929)]KFY57173.1 hypothetical protein V497_05681 [Pseudogymnoascus sp. VKM F-4516 (FW-969)]